MRHVAVAAFVWAVSTVVLGLIARVTYLVFMFGWGLL